MPHSAPLADPVATPAEVVFQLRWLHMRVTALSADGFLSFKQLKLQLEAGALITGPNGSGKSNLARCLDLAFTAAAWSAGDEAGARLEDYATAGYEGSDSFVVRVGVEMDQPAERQLLRVYLRAAVTSAFIGYDDDVVYGVDRHFSAHFQESSADHVGIGELVVRRMGMFTAPWEVSWEFVIEERRLHLRLGGSLQGQLFGHILHTGEALGGRGIPALLGQSPPFNLATLPERLTLVDLLPAEGESHDFSVRQAAGVIPPGHQRLGALLNVDLAQRGAHFGQVLSLLLSRSLLVTDNHRLPARPAYELRELAMPVPLRDGSGAAGELWRLHNGNALQRARYARAAAAFEDLTGRRLGLRTRLLLDSAKPLRVEPMVVDGSAELPVMFAGAGVQEALVLATLLAGDPGFVLVLDEPAVNLSPTMQRKLWRRLAEAQGQVVVVTHSPDIVPAQPSANLALIRLSRDEDGSHVHMPSADTVYKQPRLPQLLRRADVRALLFASGVVLCEGDTEVGALGTWWAKASWQGERLPAPDAADIALVDVGGDTAFHAYTEFLDAFSVPWVIVCDGPALEPGRGLSKQYVGHPRFAGLRTTTPTGSFEEHAEWWQHRGVYSFAEQFGNANKGGEFEAFLEHLDRARLQEAQSLYPRSKVRQGQWFAATTHCPERAAALWRAALEWLGD